MRRWRGQGEYGIGLTGLLLVVHLFTALSASAQSTGVFREVFTGLGGSTVADLTNSAAWPFSPTSEQVGGGLETPENQTDSFGQRLRTLVTVPTSGLFRFGIASDDASALYLGTNASPTGMTRIAWVNNWTGSRVFTSEANQQSGLIPLSSGQVCYLEVQHKEGGGADHLCVRWILPDGSTNTPIPSTLLTPYGRPAPVFIRQPTSTAVQVGHAVSFAATLQRTLNATLQWRRNGTNLPAATATNLVLGPLSLSDSGHTFVCVASNAHGITTSQVATLSVVPDTTPPAIVGAQYLGDGRILLTFSEPLTAAGVSNLSHYALAGPGSVVQAALLADGYRVLVVATGLTYDTALSLVVSGLTDQAVAPVTMRPATQGVAQAYTPAPTGLIRGLPEPPGPSSRRTMFAISELMYHPAARPDGRELEYVELFNSAEWAEDLGGFRLAGEVDYTIPSNTVLGARQYLVVAPVPADVQAVYGITNVIGGFAGRLGNGGGTVQLRGRLGEVLLEADYEPDPPFPVAADGAGHALVLARPSRGEGSPLAWSASVQPGGSPGAAEPTITNAWAGLVINEVLAHTDDPVEDFIELMNVGTGVIDAAGCWLSDDVATNRYAIPPGTVIPPRGFMRFTQSQLGFSLDAAGEVVVLREPAGLRVVDALRFGPQANGRPLGRYPDGGPEFSALSAATPAAPNAARHQPALVLNEIMYHPVSEDGRDEYVEVHNRTGAPMDLTGWRLRGGISFDFPTGATVAAGGYVVVAADAARLLATHPALAPGLVFGNFAGALADGGERVALEQPEEIASTNALGQWTTNLVHIVEDEVTYGDGGRWGAWADGGGSSLERVDAAADGRQATTWADSDESAKSAWTTLAVTGVLEHGHGSFAASQLHLLLLGAGECLVDNVEVIPQGSSNAVTNAAFTASAAGWLAQGTHEDSGWTAAAGEGGGGALWLRATGRGDTGVNRVRTTLRTAPAALSTATLRARVRWLKGHPELLLRLRGNWLEATGNILTATDLGTPGAANSRALAHAGPAIDGVTHEPVLPATGQAVTVYARVQDADGVAAPLLRYRQDPDAITNTVEMTRRGGGFFSAVIPAQAAGALVAYHIEATDLRLGAQAITRFPADAPAREALVRWGDPVPAGSLGAYRLWITQATAARWAAREKNSNRPLDGTFVYGGNRAVYTVGCLYSGSPFHAASFNGPTGSVQSDYTVVFPSDDLFLGTTDLLLNNTSGDSTTLRQRLCFWFARELGLPYLHRRPIYMYLNGVLRGGVISEDVQQPAGDHVAEFFPDDDRGPLHKIEDWFEFQDDGVNFSFTTATLENFLSGGAKRLARYRWNWRPRSVRGTASDFVDLFTLVDAANATAPDPYEARLSAVADTRQWMRTLAFERMTGNNDSYGYSRGKNMYAYKPAGSPWHLLTWDLDFSFGAGSDGTSTALDGSHDPVIAAFKNQPRFARQWFAALQQLVEGPMVASVVEPWIDVRYTAQQANGVGVSGRAALKTWIQNRRTYIASVLATTAVPYAVHGPSSFTTNANFVSFTGTAPVGLDQLTINGIAYAPRWTTLTTWQLDLPLAEGTNQLLFAGVDAQGLAVTNPSVLVQVISTATAEPAAGHVLINEVMYNAATSGASFVELHNAATSTTYDLSRWVLPAAGLTVPDGTLLAPGGYAVFARDAAGFAAAYGSGIPVAGVLTGELANAGEWLQLIRPGLSTNADVVIAEVEYDDLPPWPAAANGLGPSLQLMEPNQDARRVANWTAAVATPGASNAVRLALPSFGPLWLNEVVASNAVGAVDQHGEHEPWVELFNAGTAAVELAGWALTDATNDLLRWTFPTNAVIAPGGYLTVWLDAEPAEATSNELHASFRAPSATGFVALVSPGTGTPFVLDYLRPGPLPVDRAYGSIVPGSPCGRRQLGSPTPGLVNDDSAPPLTLVINEWMADNAAAVPDADDGGFADWFELHNPTDFPMPLDGARLTDNPAQPTRFIVPAGYVVPPRGFLRVWADDEDDENAPTNPALHVNFKLSKSGEQILLFAADGAPVDAITFGDQVTDRAEGRFPDGAGYPFALTAPTPGAANAYDLNHVPVLASLPASLVYRGSSLHLAVSAVDTDQPPQALTYSLAAAPSGAVIGALSGLFSWTPADEGPAEVTWVTVRVTDDGVPPLISTQTFGIAVYPVPQFEARAPAANTESYQFWTTAGHHYQVEYKDDLRAESWQVLGAPFVGEGGWHAVEEGGLPGDAQRFYRVIEWP